MLLSDKKVDDTTAGITSNSTKGLVIPPVKKTSTASWVRSYAKYIVELKSLKLYVVGFRNLGIFHEHVTNKIMDDFKKVSKPRKIYVWGKFNPRGGISTIVESSWAE